MATQKGDCNMPYVFERETAVSEDIKFYTVKDVQVLTGWSKATVEHMFRDRAFPAANYGKAVIVEKEALRSFFQVRHDKRFESHWR